MKHKIKEINAREILSTSSYPSVGVEIVLEDGTKAFASTPYGSSAGRHEPLTLIDNDPKRYGGRGMLKAVANINTKIAKALIGQDVTEQAKLDEIMRKLDGTPNLSALGGNAVTCVSLACARTASKANNLELFEYLHPLFKGKNKVYKLPQPMMVIIEGGEHAENSTDLQEYLIVCHTKDAPVKEQIRAGMEVYQELKDVLKEKGYGVNVGFEGAYAPTGIKTNEEPLELMTEAIKRSGYKLGKDISLGMDPAASEVLENGKYELTCENKSLTSDEFISYYEDLVKNFTLMSIEDGLGEDDWNAWIKMTKSLGSEILIVGDDLTVTNKKKLQEAIDRKAMNSILIKPNQAGTLTELIQTVNLAKEHDFKVIFSHRGGGETGDTFLTDAAVAAGADMIKVGPSRGERVEKFNRLMEIEEYLS